MLHVQSLVVSVDFFVLRIYILVPSAGAPHATSSSLQACVSTTGNQQAASKTAAAAGSNPKLSARLTGRPAASTMTKSHVPAAPLSGSTSIAQQVVGEGIQLADEPILAPTATQSQTRQTTDNSASQADAASATDLNAVSHTSSCRASIATSAADMEALTGESHRSSGSALGGITEAYGAGNTVSRAASPPFFLEGDAGEDSLVDFGDTKMSSDASEITMPQHQESTASCLLELDTQQQHAVRNQHQDANTLSLAFTAQASSQQQQQQQLGSSRKAASGADVQPNALRRSQAAWLCSTEQTPGVAHDARAAAAATLPCPVLQQACSKSLNAQQTGVHNAAASRLLTKDTASGQQAGVLAPSVAGNSGSKENEDVGVARVVRQVGDAQSGLERQTALQWTKPTTSSKVFLAEVEAKLLLACCFLLSETLLDNHASLALRLLAPSHAQCSRAAMLQWVFSFPIAFQRRAYDQTWRPDHAIFAIKV